MFQRREAEKVSLFLLEIPALVYAMSIDQVLGTGVGASWEITDGHTSTGPVSLSDFSGEETPPSRGSRGDGLTFEWTMPQ